MNKQINYIETLRKERRLTPEGYRSLLSADLSAEAREFLRAAAQEEATARFGHGVFLRGLIEITNICRNNCLYCGIRAANADVTRYALSDDDILESCKAGYQAGLRTVVMQGGETGENGPFPAHRIVRILERIRNMFPDLAITLSLGEWKRNDLQRFHDAGANRYLLRHETINPRHYSSLHPANMSLSHRIECLRNLQEIGFQVGTGIMVGSPGQTIENIVEDLLFIQEFSPHMVGLGPFIPHKSTPFADQPAGNLDRTLRLLSIIRLMLPSANIPSTTALATLSPLGRIEGIRAGANVVMPNISPVAIRSKYNLYDGKAHSGAEAVEGLKILDNQLADIGYHINLARGDWSPQ